MRRLSLCPALLALAGCGPAPVTVDNGAAEDEVGTTSTTAGDEAESESSEDSSATGDPGETTGDSGTDTGPPCDEVVSWVEVMSDEELVELECVREAGSITIRDTSITDLSVLAGVESLGTLTLHDNAQLDSFAGTNDALVELDELHLSGSPLLTDFSSFAPVALSRLTLGPGLSGLESVSADFSPGRLRLFRWDQPGTSALADLQPDENSFGMFEVQLWFTEGLTELSGLASCCGAVPLRVQVFGPGLVDFTGLEPLTELEQLELKGTSVESFTGLENLSSVGLFVVDEDCPSHQNTLTDFTGLSSLASVSELSVRKNPALLGFAGLDSLTSVSDLEIYDNEALVSLDFPPELDVANVADVSDNDSLAPELVQAFFEQSTPEFASSCGNGEPGDCIIEGFCPQ